MSINIDAINTELRNAVSRINTTQMIDSLDAARQQLASVQIPDMGRVAGELRGGFESLTQDVDNATEALQRALDRPTITRLTEQAAELLPALRGTIPTAELAEIDSMLNSALATGENAISEIFPQVQSTLENVAAVTHDIVSNGNVQAIAASLQTALDATIPELENVLNEVAPTLNQLQGDITQILQRVDAGEVVQNLQNAAQAMQGQISSIFGGNLTNNLLSDIANNLSGINLQLIQDTIPGLSDNIVRNIDAAIRTGDISTAQNLMFRQVSIPESIVSDLTARGINIPNIRNLQEATAAIEFLRGIYPTGNSGLTELTSLLDAITQNITTLTTSLSNIIDGSFTQNVTPPSVTVRNYSGGTPSNTQQTTQTPATPAPTTPTNTNEGTVDSPATVEESTTNNFTIIATREEVQAYLISASREFSTLIVDWTTTFTDQPLTASDLNEYYVSNNRDGIPWHFIIRRDGTIETGVPLNTEGKYAGAFNANSIGIAFVAGYNCTSDREQHRDGVDRSFLSRRSITQAQMRAIRQFLRAFYAAVPAGNVWGQNNLYPRERARVAPGFDITRLIALQPFHKVNVGAPESDGKCLTLDEIRTARAERAAGLANEVTDQN